MIGSFYLSENSATLVCNFEPVNSIVGYSILDENWILRTSQQLGWNKVDLTYLPGRGVCYVLFVECYVIFVASTLNLLNMLYFWQFSVYFTNGEWSFLGLMALLESNIMLWASILSCLNALIQGIIEIVLDNYSTRPLPLPCNCGAPSLLSFSYSNRELQWSFLRVGKGEGLFPISIWKQLLTKTQH